MTAKIITAEAAYEMTARVAHNVAEAAEYLRVSESTVRKVAKRLGVRCRLRRRSSRHGPRTLGRPSQSRSRDSHPV